MGQPTQNTVYVTEIARYSVSLYVTAMEMLLECSDEFKVRQL